MLRTYIDYVLLITMNYFKDYINALDEFLQRLTEVGLRVNAENLLFGQTETEYIGFWAINNGARPLLSKAEEIKRQLLS